MIDTIRVTVDARILRPDSDEARGKGIGDKPRLLPAGGSWVHWDLEFCIHGCKFRWACDECDEFFATKRG